MTILSSRDGKFYEVPENVLKKHEIPAEQVEAILAAFGGEDDDAPEASGPVTIYVNGNGAYVDQGDGEVEPYGYGWGWNPYYYPRRRRRRRHYYHWGY